MRLIRRRNEGRYRNTIIVSAYHRDRVQSRLTHGLVMTYYDHACQRSSNTIDVYSHEVFERVRSGELTAAGSSIKAGGAAPSRAGQCISGTALTLLNDMSERG